MYVTHHTSPLSHGRAAAWLVALFAVLALPSTALGQSNGYSPAEGSGLLDFVTVDVSGERVNQTDPDETEKNIGPIGVERCKELENASGRQVRFEFYYDTSSASPKLIQEDDRFLFDEPFNEAGSVECTPGGSGMDRDTDQCTKLSQDGNDIIFETISGGEIVTFTWEALREEDDREVAADEECVFPADPDRGQTGGDAGNGGDAGDTGDAGGDTGMDSSMADGMDTDSEAGETDVADATGGDGQAGSAPSVPAPKTDDHVYAVRLFLTDANSSSTDNYRSGDAALRLDRTRPSGPQNARAAATENVLRVRFDTPSNRQEIESYHVFYSDNRIPSFQDKSPEQLIDEGSVTRELLIGDADDRSGTLEDEITGIEKQQGNELYVAIASRDEARNYSPLARIQPNNDGITVQKSIDFWERYLGDGGAEEGGFGCRAVDGPPIGPSVLLVLAGLWGLRRRW